ncbi:unannotated protein [freshwater metagenome]|uniref:Unannotated protein n=1 Tax=freshwater metagenome TaxID=449393 RepID=A0A6J7K367_9ZZZZ|nr:hypothetical protein [Actinomycetota bacterium]
MKFQRPALIIISTAAVVLAANGLNVDLSNNKFSTNFPAVVCPPTPSNLTTTISLPSSKTPLRRTGTKSLSFVPAQTLRYQQAKAPVIIESQGSTPIVWQTRKGIWAGATICSSLQSQQWFVGGTADVTSKGRLLIVNSGLSPAIVDLEIWNEIGAQPTKPITLKANSYSEFGLDALAPGSKELVIRALTRSGRVTSYMLDERGRGLKALGGDIINFAPRAERNIYIPAVAHTVRKVGSKSVELSHTLRLLVPGELDAHVTVNVLSTDGSFIPAGFENKLVKAGSVVSLELNPNLPTSKFGLHISSDEPLVASVYSPTFAEKKSDFIWSTSAPELSKITLATSGLSPQLIFIGGAIKLDIELKFDKGKRKIVNVRGEEIATIKIPAGVRSITFVKVAKGIYGAGLISSKSGYGYFPLAPGSVLTKSSVPLSNIRVLTP